MTSHRPNLTRNKIELAVFFFVVLLPAILPDTQSLSPAAAHRNLFSRWGYIHSLVGSLQFGVLAGFLLFFNPYDSSFLRLSPPKLSILKQIAAGVGLWFAYYLFFDFLGLLSGVSHIRTGSTAWFQPQGEMEMGRHVLFSFVNGISEEVMRVYLLSQVLKLGAGRKSTIAIVAALIASYHWYQGPINLAGFFLANLLFNRLYLTHKSILMLIVWHILADFKHSTDLVGWDIVSAFVSVGSMDVLSFFGIVDF